MVNEQFVTQINYSKITYSRKQYSNAAGMNGVAD